MRWRPRWNVSTRRSTPESKPFSSPAPATGIGSTRSRARSRRCAATSIWRRPFCSLPSDAGLVAPIFVMLREHGEIWATMDALGTHLSENTGSGSGADSCRELLTQLERHNAKEEAIIYPQADTVLPPDAAASLRAFLACGRMPEGWACQQAGAEAP